MKTLSVLRFIHIFYILLKAPSLYPKELFRVILILCDFSFCANIRTSSKRKCFFIVYSQVRNTKKFLKGKINRIMSDDGQGKF